MENYSTIIRPLPWISPYSPCSLTGAIALMGVLTGSAVWPAANLAFFIPFALSERVAITRLGVNNGAAVNGNFDIGIYDFEGNRIVHSGSTAQAGVNTLQSVVVSATFGPGVFYLALVLDNAVGRVMRTTLFANIAPAIFGMAQMAAAFPLPAQAVFAQITGNYIPYCQCLLAPRTVT